MSRFLLGSLVFMFLISCGKAGKSSRNEEDFSVFFDKFSKDSAFQVSRVKFPVTALLFTSSDRIRDTLSIEQAQWKFMDFAKDKSARFNKYEKYEPLLLKEDEHHVIYRLEGIGQERKISYHFEQQEGTWYMVKLSDDSPKGR